MPDKSKPYKKTLEELTKHEFDILRTMGLLWEFYPKAPNSYNQIKRNKEDARIGKDK